MAANVLSSEWAVRMSVYVTRAFIKKNKFKNALKNSIKYDTFPMVPWE